MDYSTSSAGQCNKMLLEKFMIHIFLQMLQSMWWG